MTAAVTPPAGQERIVFLDYLRIFAFASVFAGHKFAGPVQEMAQQAGLAGAAARALWPFIEGGGAGVVVFFLVSGYVISEVLQREGAALFLLRRVFRIYPLYVTAVLGEWLLVHPPATGGERLAQLLLAGDFTGAPYALAGVEWTLRLEMLFYAWMALLRLANLTRPARGAAWLSACALLTLTLHVAGPVAAHTPWARLREPLHAVSVCGLRRLAAGAPRDWLAVGAGVHGSCLGPLPAGAACLAAAVATGALCAVRPGFVHGGLAAAAAPASLALGAGAVRADLCGVSDAQLAV